ncbi:hypothetical protein P885DRAFT_73110 [Corynascus similis CBS 632.67]
MSQLIKLAGLIALISTLTNYVSARSKCPNTGDEQYLLRLGDGYRYSKLELALWSPHHMVVDTEGNLLVVEGGSVRRLVLEELDDIVCVQSGSDLTSEDASNTGIALSADGKTLFTSTEESVWAYDYDAVTGQVGQRKEIVTNMKVGLQHIYRPLLTSKYNPDTILVARGSRGDIDPDTTDPAVARSVIKAFSISEGLKKTHDYARDGEVLAWGIREVVAMAEHPVFGGIWAVESQMDDVHFNGRDIHITNPAERLTYHGVLNDTENPYKGLNYGYPSCAPAWDTESIGIDGLQVGDLFKPDGVPDIPDGECANRMKGRLHFEAHAAPRDIKFNMNGTAAYIAFHGGWDPDYLNGFRVVRIDFGPDGQPVHPANSKTAQVPVFENVEMANCPLNCFLPSGLAIDKKGRIFLSNDQLGYVYVIYEA